MRHAIKNRVHSRRRHRLNALAITALVSCWGCSDDDASTPREPPGCRKDALEADLEASPLSGPAVDETTGQLRPPAAGERYIISATYGAPKQEPAVLERWGELMGAIQTQLASQPGLLALSLGSSPACGSGRTLAVWSSEEAMYEFVTSPAHAAAMAAAGEILRPGFRTTHWEATTTDQMTHEEGVRRLAEPER